MKKLAFYLCIATTIFMYSCNGLIDDSQSIRKQIEEKNPITKIMVKDNLFPLMKLCPQTYFISGTGVHDNNIHFQLNLVDINYCPNERVEFVVDSCCEIPTIEFISSSSLVHPGSYITDGPMKYDVQEFILNFVSKVIIRYKKNRLPRVKYPFGQRTGPTAKA